MSTSFLYHGFSLVGHDYVRTRYAGGAVIFSIKRKRGKFRCLFCRSRDIIFRGTLSRRFRTVPLVYPLARGSGPLFVPMLAVVLLGEEIALLGGIGILFIIGGIYCVHLRSFTSAAFLEPFRALRGGASLWALFTGLAIAFYSLVDKVGVGLVYPPVYIYVMMLITWLVITPWVLIRERHGLKSEWRRHKGAIVVVGFLSGFTYLMILFALTMSKVSYVAAVREVSIVLSAYFGIVYLGEKHGRQKLLGAALIALGVVAIGLSR
jgi:uncharacterized membrane protein